MRYKGKRPSTVKGFFIRAFGELNQQINTNIIVIEDSERRKVIRAYGTGDRVYEFVKVRDERQNAFYYVDDVTDPANKQIAEPGIACMRVLNRFDELEVQS